MYEVKLTEDKILNFPDSSSLDGSKVTTFTREVYSANCLQVEAGTTGYCGGDSGHGARTYFRIEDIASTDIAVNVIPPGRKGQGGFEVALGGDCEIDTIIKALKFIVKVLEEESKPVND